MAQTVLLKRSSVAGNVPGSSDLSLGEIAVNTADGAIYIKKGNNDIVAVADNDILHIDTTNSRIGIGTTNPSSKLHVNSGTSDWPIKAESTDAKAGIILSDNNTTNYIMSQTYTLSLGNQPSVHASNLNIKSTGNVGIGTTSPATNLEISGSAPKLRITDSRSQTFTVGDIMSSIEFDSDDTSGGAGTSSEPRAAINMYAASTFGSSTGLEFRTKSDTTGYPVQQMVIDNTGNVGIGTSSPAANLNVYTDAGRDFRVDHGTANRTILSTDRGMIVKAGSGYSLELDTGSDTGSILFKDNGVTHSQFNASGNLALGTTTHFTTGGAAKLTVAGILSFGASNSDMSYIRRIGSGQYQWQTYNSDNVGDIQLQPYGGNVGIGTTAPTHKLHISTSATGVYIQRELSSNAANLSEFNSHRSLIIKNRASGSFLMFGGNGARTDIQATDGAGTPTAKNIALNPFGGKVGIGQDTPRLALEVKDTVNSDGEVLYLMGKGTGGAGIVYSRDDSFTWYSGVGGGSGTGSIPLSFFGIVNRSQGGVALSIAHTTNNVGIGTTSPDSSLEVAGGSTGIILSNLGNSSAYDQVAMTYNGYNSGTPEFIFQPKTAPGSGTVNSYFRFKSLSGGGGGSNVANVTIDGALTVGNAYTFPTADGSTNQVLKTDGSGNLTFATIAGASGGTSISDSDGDTKIQVEESSDEDKIRFDTAGSERMQIDALGRVGIGEISAGSTLHVYNSAGATATFKRDADAYLTIDHGSSGANLKSGGSIGFYASGSSVNSLTISSTLFRVNEIAEFTNNVGIGTTSPNSYSNQKVLTINGTTHSRIDFETADTLRGSIYGDSGSLNLDAGGNYLRFYTGNTQKMTLLANGNLGINETNPVQKLQVNGNIRADGHYYVGGDIVIDSSKNLTNIGTVTATGPVSIETGAPSLVLKDTTDDDDHTIRFKNSANGTVMEITSLGDNFNFQTFGSRDIVFSPAETTALTLSGANGTFANNLTVTGNLTVNGTQTILNTATLDVEDLNITVAKGATNSAGANGAGLTVDCGSDTDTTFTYNGTSGQWNMNTELVIQPRHTGGTPPSLTLGDLNNQYQSGIASSSHLTMRAGGSGNQYWQNDGTYLMMLTSGGDLSIGNSTTAPTNHRVHIKTAVDDSVAQGLVIERSNNTDRGYINYQGGGFQFRSTVGDPIVFGETDAEHMRILPDGNVGIGTTSPLSGVRLDVRGGNIHVGGYGSGADYGIRYSAPDNSSHWYTYADTGGELVFGRSGTIGSEEKVRFDSSGRVGIGTNNPEAALHISGTSAEQIKLQRTNHDTFRIGLQSAVGLGFHNVTDSRTDMIISGGGNVGIGTTSPGSRLNVLHSSNATNGITVENATTGTSARSTVRLVSDAGQLDVYVTSSTYNGVSSWTDAGVLSTSSTTSGGLVLNAQSGGIKFQDATTEIMRISDGGKVGIGTATLTNKFHVSGDARIEGSLMAGGASASNVPARPIHVKSAGDAAAIRIEDTTSSNQVFDFRVTHGEGLRFINVTGATTPMFIETSGNVGIGTDNPGKPLHVKFSGDSGVQIESDTSHSSLYIDSDTGYGQYIRFSQAGSNKYWINSDTNGNLLFRPAATGVESNIITFSSSGRVGIGKTTVKAKFQVEEYGIDTTSTASSATAQIAIHSFAAADFRSARFTVQVTNSTDSTYHTSELLLVHNGTTANITEFGEIHTGSAVEATFDADINSGNVRLLATPASTDTMAFKVVCHSITT